MSKPKIGDSDVCETDDSDGEMFSGFSRSETRLEFRNAGCD